jgi:hypothetical protein
MTTLSFRFYQGHHSPTSPVLGSCANDLLRIFERIEKEPILNQFEEALYYKENSPSLNYLIPSHQKGEADVITKHKFLNYIERYTLINPEISEDTIVDWLPYTALPGESPGSCAIVERYDNRNRLGWHVIAKVREKNDLVYIKEDKYLPHYLVAYHEIQHVEDTQPNTERNSQLAKIKGAFRLKGGCELKETLKTQLLCDEVYKQINLLGIESEVDYGKFVFLGDKEIPLGAVLNFYRKLEERYHGSLCDALLSPQSTEFLTKGGL